MPTRGEAAEGEVSSGAMVWLQGCKAERARVATGSVTACGKGGVTRKEICAKDHSGSNRGEA